MMIRIQCFLTTALLMQTSVTGFTAQFGRMPRRHTITEMQSTTDPESESMFIMAKARECADSETCSIEEAESYLADVIRLQSACAGGGAVGYDPSYFDICEDITIPNDIIVSLRQKIEASSKTPANALTIKSMMNPVFASMFTIYLVSSIANLDHEPGVDSFTMQEVWWAARDGYFNELISQFFKNGGLAAVDVSSGSATPFTSNEWMWSMRDGYLPIMLTHYFRDGGLTDIDAARVLPFTSDEWMWSVRDGYFPTMMKHYLSDGGLQ